MSTPIFKIYDTYIAPATDELLDIGSSALEFKDLYIDGIAYIDEIHLDLEEQIQFRDEDIHISSKDDGHLDIDADISVDINGLMCTENIEPLTNDTYYVGKNSISTPKAYKGIILKDTTNGNYYRIEIISSVLTVTQIT